MVITVLQLKNLKHIEVNDLKVLMWSRDFKAKLTSSKSYLIKLYVLLFFLYYSVS